MKLTFIALAILLISSTTKSYAQAAIEKLEAEVSRVDGEHRECLKKLRKVYRGLETELSKLSRIKREKLELELGRVIEPLVNDLRPQAKGNLKRARRNLLQITENKLPGALEQLKVPALRPLRGWIDKRFRTLVLEAKKPKDLLDLEYKDIAALVLRPIIDDKETFPKRWNAVICEEIPEAQAFRSSYEALEKARLDLALARDPLLIFQVGAPKGFARIDPGNYVMSCLGGTLTTLRKRDRKISLKRPIWMGLREVTNKEYWSWLQSLPEADRDVHLPRHDRTLLWPRDEKTGVPTPPEDTLDCPVTGVRLGSALAYAASKDARLPTENEWCAAAGGPDNLLYPWGKEYAPDHCNDKKSGKGGVIPVGSYENGRGHFGHYDLAGNASEWTMTGEDGKLLNPAAMKDPNANAVIRGGSFLSPVLDVRTGWVGLQPALYTRDRSIGFRLVMEIPKNAGGRRTRR